MNSHYTSALEAMQQYVDVMERLASAINKGQEALVRMDLPAFELLTVEQEALCVELKQAQSHCRESRQDNHLLKSADNPADLQRDSFEEERRALRHQCIALEERVRHLNRVNHFFLSRARQWFEMLVRLAPLSEGAYSPPRAEYVPEHAGRRG
jgi:hypothetical protein